MFKTFSSGFIKNIYLNEKDKLLFLYKIISDGISIEKLHIKYISGNSSSNHEFQVEKLKPTNQNVTSKSKLDTNIQ